MEDRTVRVSKAAHIAGVICALAFLASCSSESESVVEVTERKCSQTVVDRAAQEVAGRVIVRLRELSVRPGQAQGDNDALDMSSSATSEKRDVEMARRRLLESECRTFARGLVGGFFYGSAMMDEAERAGCDWASVPLDADKAGLKLLLSQKEEANRLCGGRIDDFVAVEGFRERGRQVLDSMSPDDRRAAEEAYNGL